MSKASKDQITATEYELAAFLQQEVADRLLERLDYMRIKPSIILDLGAATGYATHKLKERYPKAQLIALDSRENLLTTFKHSWWKKDPTRVCTDLEKIPLNNNSVDLIFSNLSLHTLNDPQFCFKEWQRILKPEGLLLFTSFGPDTLRELRISLSELKFEYNLRNFIDMHHLGDILLNIGFQDPVMDMEMITLSYTDLKKLIKDIHYSGVEQNAQPLMDPTNWNTLSEQYAKLRLENQQLPATFEILYGHAWKAKPSLLGKMNEQGEVEISVQSITIKEEIK